MNSIHFHGVSIVSTDFWPYNPEPRPIVKRGTVHSQESLLLTGGPLTVGQRVV